MMQDIFSTLDLRDDDTNHQDEIPFLASFRHACLSFSRIFFMPLLIGTQEFRLILLRVLCVDISVHECITSTLTPYSMTSVCTAYGIIHRQSKYRKQQSVYIVYLELTTYYSITWMFPTNPYPPPPANRANRAKWVVCCYRPPSIWSAAPESDDENTKTTTTTTTTTMDYKLTNPCVLPKPTPPFHPLRGGPLRHHLPREGGRRAPHRALPPRVRP